jgi:UDP-N-acetylmuramoylalanine--D-glutamate ligase
MASGITSKIVEIRNENIKRCMGDTIAHRQQYIGTIDGVIYYDDSKAENVNATWFTFENIVNPVVWIVGGSCHNNYSELIDTARKKVRSIISIGNEQESIEMTFRSVVKEIYSANSIEEAVSMASAIASENDLVLFSPACKDNEMDYNERGDRFVKEVKKL